MSIESIELLIDKEHNPLQSVTKHIDNVIWKLSIKRNEQLEVFLKVECAPVQPCQYWECDLIFDILILNKQRDTVPLYENRGYNFSNYTCNHIIKLNSKSDSVQLNIKQSKLEVFAFTKKSLFDEPVDNITDFKLIIEGQQLYVCKNILATYSQYFYKLFYICLPIKSEYVIPESCNSFRVFLGVIHGQDSLLTKANVLTIGSLAASYTSEDCLEKCVEFLNKEDFPTQSKEQHLEHFCRLKHLNAGATYFDASYIQQGCQPSMTEKRPNLTDMVLSVGDKKFHVSKQLLAYHSSYFYTMFFSNFVEKEKDEIELKQIDAKEFEMFLQFVHHPNRGIEVEYVEALFTLSEMYDAQLIVQKCIDFLKVNKDANDIKKIQDRVIDKLNFNDLTRLYAMQGFNELDDSTVAKLTRLLLEKQQQYKSNKFFAPFLSHWLPPYIQRL